MTEVRINVADLKRLEDEARQWKDNYREVNISLMQAGEKIDNLVTLLNGRMEIDTRTDRGVEMDIITVQISVARDTLVRSRPIQRGFWNWLAEQLAREITRRMRIMYERGSDEPVQPEGV